MELDEVQKNKLREYIPDLFVETRKSNYAALIADKSLKKMESIGKGIMLALLKKYVAKSVVKLLGV